MLVKHSSEEHLLEQSGPGCSKLTTSLVHVSLNFQKLIVTHSVGRADFHGAKMRKYAKHLVTEIHTWARLFKTNDIVS